MKEVLNDDRCSCGAVESLMRDIHDEDDFTCTNCGRVWIEQDDGTLIEKGALARRS